MKPTAGSDSEDPSDDELVRASRAGDAPALARLYRRHAGVLTAYLRRTTGAGIDAEDILQETFLRIFEGKGVYEARGRFRSWLFTIATRLVRDRQRQIARHAELQSLEADLLSPVPPPGTEEGIGFARLTARIRRALAELPPLYSEAFFLRVTDDLSYREMARLSGEPEGTLRSRVFHAVKTVRRALAEDAAQTGSEDHDQPAS